jgi:hypothetical protein
MDVLEEVPGTDAVKTRSGKTSRDAGRAFASGKDLVVELVADAIGDHDKPTQRSGCKLTIGWPQVYPALVHPVVKPIREKPSLVLDCHGPSLKGARVSA